MDRRRQDVEQQAAARRIEIDVAAEDEEVLAVAKPRNRVGADREAPGRASTGLAREVGRKDERARRGNQEHISFAEAEQRFLAVHRGSSRHP